MTIGKDDRRFVVLFLALITVALLAVFFRTAPPSLIHAWDSPEFSYCGPLVLVAIGWAVSLYRKNPLSAKPEPLGASAVGLAVLMNLFGMVAANNWVNHYSIVVMIAALVLTFCGRQIFRQLFPALFLLSFAVPLPPLFLASLTAEMQLLSSTLSVAILKLLGVSVFQEGNIIDLGVYKLQVAEACSGLRYLFPFLTFGYLFAFLFESAFWKRAVLILATFPITIAMNVVRIVFVGVTVNAWGIRMAEGFLHDFEGMSVFVLCLLLLGALVWALSFFPPPATSAPASPAHIVLRTRPSLEALRRSLLIIALLLLAGILSQSFLSATSSFSSPARLLFADFPLSIGDWQGRTDTLPLDQIDALKLTDYALIDYKNRTLQGSVNFFSAYYASQQRDAAPHSPLVCMNGAGWEITSMTSGYPVLDAGGHPFLEVNRAIIERENTRALVYFWFQERGRDLTSNASRKWYLLRDSLVRHRTDGALMRVVTPMNEADDRSAADQRLTDFLRGALPALSQFVPD